MGRIDGSDRGEGIRDNDSRSTQQKPHPHTTRNQSIASMYSWTGGVMRGMLGGGGNSVVLARENRERCKRGRVFYLVMGLSLTSERQWIIEKDSSIPIPL